jgi:hypothetical protein
VKRLHPLLAKLTGGDLRSIGRSEEAAREVLADPRLFPVLMSGLTSEDARVRMRAADAAEKVTAVHPKWLAPFKDRLLGEIAAQDQQEVRWHAALMIGRLELDRAGRRRAVALLKRWIEDESRIVQVNSLQALADLSKRDPGLRSRTIALINSKIKDGPPSIRARGRKLLKQLAVR